MRVASRLLAVMTAACAAVAVAAAPAVAEPATGTLTLDEPTGTDTTLVHGVTDGSCHPAAPLQPDSPLDGFNAVVTGPGPFAADPAHGYIDGHAIVSTTGDGFSTTDPIRFTFRLSFGDLAEELHTALLPGEYVVTLRCVNQLSDVVYQKFAATFTFSGGSPVTIYRVTSPMAGKPPVSVVATPTASDAPPASAGGRPSGGVPVVVGVGVGALVLAAAGGVAYGARRRKVSGRR